MIKRYLVLFYLLLLLGMVSSGNSAITPAEHVASRYLFSVSTWEFANAPTKWVLQVVHVFQHYVSQEQKLALVHEYFAPNDSLATLEQDINALSRPAAKAGLMSYLSQSSETQLRTQAQALSKRKAAISPRVEEIFEATLSDVLVEQGIVVKLGPVTTPFPPVDIHLGLLPKVLAMSPRGNIALQQTILLRGDMSADEVSSLESAIEKELDVSAYISDLLGLATYPAIVQNSTKAQEIAATTAHELLHHYFAFRPLGQHMGDSDEMRTMNETTADLGGVALGALLFERLNLAPNVPVAILTTTPAPTDFVFRAEMQKTRIQTEALLGQGKVQEAEAYMQQRRLEFAEHGYNIRKINQAFLAFYGGYDESGATVSVVPGQLKQLQDHSSSVGDFIRTVSGIGNTEELLRKTAQLAGQRTQ